MKTKSRSKLNVEDDLIRALSRTELRVSMLSNNKQAQPTHFCSARRVIEIFFKFLLCASATVVALVWATAFMLVCYGKPRLIRIFAKTGDTNDF